jgi:hypothetical protein
MKFTKAAGGYVFDDHGFEFIVTRNEAGFSGRQWAVESVPPKDGPAGLTFSKDQLPTRKAAVIAALVAVREHAEAPSLRSISLGGEASFYTTNIGVVTGIVVDRETAPNGKAVWIVKLATNPLPVRVSAMYVRAIGLSAVAQGARRGNADKPGDDESLVVAEIALFEKGERIEITTRLGTTFGATFVDRYAFAGERALYFVDPSIKLAIKPDERGAYAIPYSGIRAIRSAPVAPALDEIKRARALDLIDEALDILKAEKPSREAVLVAERKLQEAANAAHWAAVPFGPALAAATRLTTR